MKKIIGFWLNRTYLLNELNESEGFLFNDLCLNLSSEFIVTCERNEQNVNISVEKNYRYQKDFFSKDISDVKVLVGNNGTGKTAILSNLFRIIATSKFPQKGDYIIIYVDENKIFINSSDSINANLAEIPKGYVKGVYEPFLQNELILFFTPEFKGIQDIEFNSNYRNISTDGYLYRDKIDLFEKKSIREIEFEEKGEYEELYDEQINREEALKQKDSIFIYNEMELNRIIDFILNVGDYFFHLIPIPSKMMMSPLVENIDAGIAIATELIIHDKKLVEELLESGPFLFDDEHILIYTSSDSRGKNIYENDEDILRRKIPMYLWRCYDCYDVETKLLFAGMLSCIRTYWAMRPNEETLFDFNIDWYSLQNSPKQALEKFFESNKSNEIYILGQSIKRIILETKNNEKLDDAIVFDLRKRKNEIKKVRDICNALYYKYPLFSFRFSRSMSSGEQQFLRLYSRLYDCLKRSIKEKINLDSICLLIDEVDVFMHPEWQRKWLKVFVELAENLQSRLKIQKNNQNNKPGSTKYLRQGFKIQLVIATHSPFILTDCLNDNILKLKRNDNFGPVECVENNSKPFAGNILDILQSGFFLNSTTGELTDEKIDNLISRIQNKKLKKKDWNLLNSIGNPILKTLLKRKATQEVHFD